MISQPGKHERRTLLLFLLILTLFVTIGSTVIYFNQRHQLIQQATFHAEQEMELIGKLITEALIKSDYVTVEQFITQWAQKRPDLMEAKLSVANGFVLASYSRVLPSQYPLPLKRQLKYGDQGRVSMDITWDLTPVHQGLNRLLIILAAMPVILVLSLLLFLWWVLRRTLLKPIHNQLLESEQRFRQLAENLDEVFWLGAQDWSEVLYVSPAYEKNWGLSAQALYEKPRLWIESIHHDDRQQVLADIPENPNDILDCIDFKEYRMRGPDGQIRWIKARAYPIRDSDGKFIRLAGIAQDITERVKMEKSLRRSQKMETIGQLSGGIAHDFNNQLGVIVGYLDFLKDHVADDETASKWVSAAVNASMRCIDLTRQLLVFSRRQAKVKTVINLNDSLKELENMIARSVTPEVEVQYFSGDDLWLTQIDPGELQDAILNMVMNARDAMPDGGKLTIETSNQYLDEDYTALNHEIKAGNYVLLMLSDTGSGMSRETLEHIFEPFFTTKTEGKGTGLGLAMVYGFTKRYGGYIKVYSEPSFGTTFRLYLPRSGASEADAITEINCETDLPCGRESILIVEDEIEMLRLADKYLHDLGYHTHTAENATQALEVLSGKETFDLLFSDVVMPGGMNGYQLAQRATRQQPELKVLLTSGFTSKSLISNELSRFSIHSLTKPYHKSDLAQRVRQVLDEKKTR